MIVDLFLRAYKICLILPLGHYIMIDRFLPR
jgi:hypothetical protein